jgi:hypothetical protein
MFRALKEERKIKLILNTLQKNMKKLLRRYTTLDDKTGTDKIETADAFLAFAKNDCIEFCTKVYKAFPREIRDTIYGYVTGFEDVYITCHPKGKAHGRMKKVKHVSRLQESELCLDALQDEAEHGGSLSTWAQTWSERSGRTIIALPAFCSSTTSPTLAGFA